MNTNEIMSAMIFGDGGASKIEELSTDGGSTDAGKVLVVGDNGKIAASDLSVGEGEVAIDKTLSVNGAAADAKKVGDAISAVNGSLDDVKADLVDVKNAVFESIVNEETADYTVNSAGSLNTSKNKLAVDIPANTDFTLLLSTVDTSKRNQFTYYLEDVSATELKNKNWYLNRPHTNSASNGIKYIRLYSSPADMSGITQSDTLTLTVTWEIGGGGEQSIEYILNAHGEEIEEIKSDVSEIENALTVITSPIYEDIPTSITVEDGYYGAGGSYHDGTNYKHSQKISVIEGDIITPVSVVSTAFFRFVCAYNGTSVDSSAGVSSGTTSYTVPSGIDGLIVSFVNSQQITAVNIKRATGEETTVYPVSQKLGYINWKGSLSDSTNVKLLSSNVRFNVVWAFTGHVSTMGKVTIGITVNSSTFKELCSVDATNIYYRQQNGNITSEAHGLSVSEDLQIRIESAFLVNELKKIVICSGGTEFSPIGKPYGTDMNGAPTLISDGATMTDCAFSWIPQDIDKPIWVFGDSWVSMYDTRWTYYMSQAGFVKSWMLNGYAGEKTETALIALKNLMTIRKPDYIVWLLGMNNGDTSSAVNSTWKSVYDELISICEAYKITLILYTVPNTPTINNNFKNDIVRNSGYRYIDGAAAVGDDGNGNWFTSYEQSASDHNHTSSKGARALFMRILTDFPEIASSGL